jgi:antitoxin component YwqK of YwqJK toxin-antitoxin module
MKLIFSFLFSILSFISTAQVLTTLPAASLFDLEGNPVLSTSISNGDNPTVVITYASWSAFSLTLLDELTGAYAEAKRYESGVKIVAINCESTLKTSAVIREASEHGWLGSIHLLHDRSGNFTKATKTRVVGKVFFLDANKNIIYCVESCNISASQIHAIAASIKNKKISAEKLYFDSQWFPCEKSEAIYYREIVKDSLGLFHVTDHFMNGQAQMQGTCSLLYPSYRTGIYTYYYASGQKKYGGAYTNNEKSGSWMYWHEDGTFQSKLNYVDGKKDGEAQEFFPNGKLQSEGFYSEDLPDGMWVEYYENGAKREQRQWNKGLIISTIGWYENGVIRCKVKYAQNNYVGILETYYNNGQRISQVIYDRDSAITEIKQYYETGELKSSKRYERAGKINFTEYYPGGKQKMSFMMRDEYNLDGKFTEWYENGNKKKELEYENGTAINKGMAWYENGQLKEEFDFTTKTLKQYAANGKTQKKIAVSELEAFCSRENTELLLSQTVDFYRNVLD